jgi:hypothetical protein
MEKISSVAGYVEVGCLTDTDRIRYLLSRVSSYFCVQVASDAAVQFHRPAALGTARMGGSLVTSPHKHTVTTGLPKFCEGKPCFQKGLLLVSCPQEPSIITCFENQLHRSRERLMASKARVYQSCDILATLGGAVGVSTG